MGEALIEAPEKILFDTWPGLQRDAPRWVLHLLFLTGKVMPLWMAPNYALCVGLWWFYFSRVYAGACSQSLRAQGTRLSMV